MNKYLVFPYDHNLSKILDHSAGRMEGVIEDLLTMEGWKELGSQVKVGNNVIRVKCSIDEVSKDCNSIWIVETYYHVDFVTVILPVLIYAREKHWSVFYGRAFSENEEKIIKTIIKENKLFFLGFRDNKNDFEDKLYDIKEPVVWIVNMFSRIPSYEMSLEIYRAFQQLGYSVGFVSKRKDISMIREIESFPDIATMNQHEIIKVLNHFFKKVEKKKKHDLLLVELPGNLLEVSRKIYGDYGGMAFLMSKALPPDSIICNIPYMDRILEKKIV